MLHSFEEPGEKGAESSCTNSPFFFSSNKQTQNPAEIKQTTCAGVSSSFDCGKQKGQRASRGGLSSRAAKALYRAALCPAKNVTLCMLMQREQSGLRTQHGARCSDTCFTSNTPPPLFYLLILIGRGRLVVPILSWLSKKF